MDILYQHGQANFGVEGEGLVHIHLGERFEGVGVIEEDRSLPPPDVKLSQNIPNPFNTSTHIGFQIPGDAYVRLTVHSVTGQQVRALVVGRMEAGAYRVRWDGKDEAGNAVGTGLYLCRMVARSVLEAPVVLVPKMVLVQ